MYIDFDKEHITFIKNNACKEIAFIDTHTHRHTEKEIAIDQGIHIYIFYILYIFSILLYTNVT